MYEKQEEVRKSRFFFYKMTRKEYLPFSVVERDLTKHKIGLAWSRI